MMFLFVLANVIQFTVSYSNFYSDRVRAILSSLQKDKKIKLVMVDTNALEGSRSNIDRDMLDNIVNGRYSRQHTSVIPTDLLCSDISKFCFRQIFMYVSLYVVLILCSILLLILNLFPANSILSFFQA